MPSRNLRKFEFRLGRQGLVFFILGMSVLIFLVFVFGVMVGVHIDAYPERIASAVPEFFRGILRRPAEKTANIGDESRLPSVTEGRKQVAAALFTPSGTVIDSQEDKMSAPEEAGTKPAATNPALEEKTPPADEGEPPPLVEKKYQLQVGSFKSNGQAKKFCAKITALGYDPQIVMVELRKQGKWFRVVINDFPTRDEAKSAAGVLSEKIKGLSYMIRPNK